MSKIISFPFAAQGLKSGPQKPRVTTPLVVNNQIHLGPWEFTCPKCKAPTKFESTNMIFRQVDFYCATCGAMHRVTNPAFTPTPPPAKK